MDHFTRLKRQAANYLTIIMLISGTLLIASWWLASQVLKLNSIVTLIILLAEVILLAVVVPMMAVNYLLEPVRFLWQAILHVGPEASNSPAPNLNDSRLGRELITSLCLQVYQLASNTSKSSAAQPAQAGATSAQSIASSLPLPTLVMDKDQTIVFANEAARKYTGREANQLLGQNLYSCLDLSFDSNDTLDNWLADSKQRTATNSHSWERVHYKHPDIDQPLQLDMAAYYNKDNPDGFETIITLFDHTASYGKEDDSISYVALAVHELRTPLTLLRGYIEMFQEELAGKLDPEQADYMNKMESAAKRLTAFINNILNIARVEANQLVLQLREENWNDIVKTVANDMEVQAKARGKTIQLSLAADLPTVAADGVNIYEVLSNLIDNGLKYSGSSQVVKVYTSLNREGQVQTIVEDRGVGIPDNVLPHLFEKFYRSHRTLEKITGTGLGLYLSKVIVTAHGGQVIVNSKEGQGTKIGFTLQPYSQLADEAKNGDNGIERNAYGWIKNHSLLRK